MPRKARPHPKPKRQPTQIRAWREHRGLTLEQVSERLELMTGMELSHGQLSRIERGESPYTQDTLEALAVVLNATPPLLINVDPLRPNGLWHIAEQVPAKHQAQAAKVLETFLEGPGKPQPAPPPADNGKVHHLKRPARQPR